VEIYVVTAAKWANHEAATRKTESWKPMAESESQVFKQLMQYRAIDVSTSRGPKAKQKIPDERF
jgi:hypothetical protein